MKPIIFLHIGGGKTGSSAIQSLLRKNSKKLESQGILYPKSMLFDGGNENSHTPLFSKLSLFSVVERKEWVKKSIDYLKESLLSEKYHTAIISHEGMDPNNLFIKELAEQKEIDLKIVVYVRRQDLWIESGWKQWGSKHKDCNTIEDWISLTRAHPFWSIQLDWFRFINRWEKYVPREDVNVRVYEKNQLRHQNLLHDFCEALSIKDFPSFILPDNNSVMEGNRGYDRDVVELTRMCKVLLKNEHDNSLFTLYESVLDKRHFKDHFSSYNLLNYNQRQEILAYYKESNRKTASRYLKREILFQDEVQKDDSVYNDSNNGLERIVPLLMEMILNQHKRINKLEGHSFLENINPTLKNLFNSKKEKICFNLKRTDDNRFRIIGDINSLKYRFGKLYIHSVGNDPRFDFEVELQENNDYKIHIVIQCPAKTVMQVYYAYKNAKPLYVKERVISFNCDKGNNMSIFNFSPQEIITRLRIDVGNVPGNYILKSMSIYELV